MQVLLLDPVAIILRNLQGHVHQAQDLAVAEEAVAEEDKVY